MTDHAIDPAWWEALRRECDRRRSTERPWKAFRGFMGEALAQSPRVRQWTESFDGTVRFKGLTL